MAGQWQIALISEPYVGGDNEVKNIPGVNIFQFPGGRRVKACIMVKSGYGPVLGISQYSSANLSVVQIMSGQRKIYIASVYIEPEHDAHNTLGQLEVFLKATSGTHQIVGGDLNGWHPVWGGARANPRGTEVAELAYSTDLYFCNSGSCPTFETVTHGRVRSSIIDITMASSNIFDKIRNWQVDLSVCPSSQHNGITFSINVKTLTDRPTTILPFYTNPKRPTGQFSSIPYTP
ncbi:uncharacterized protein [Epargyreus clarus]|uniref:uncharacterized protein n=1 Tax=Epargyreus clarus TaxID=520877 RepID=UPI003C2F38A4